MFERAVPFKAAETPRAPAFWAGGADVSYERFNRDIGAVASILSVEGWPIRDLVLIDVANLALRWVIALAIERLGLIWVVAAPSPANLQSVAPDAIITDKAGAFGDYQGPLYRIDRTWIDSISANPPMNPASRSSIHPDDPVVMVLSSGTTGERKKAVLTRAILDARIQTILLTDPARARLCCTMGMDTVGGLTYPIAAWCKGDTSVLSRAITPEVLERGRPEILLMSPEQLHNALDASEDAFSTLPKKKIMVGGSATPPALVRRLRQRVGADLHTGYGSTETGWVAYGSWALCDERPGAAGRVAPWAEVKIVSPDGELLPHGESGEVFTRTDSAIAGYLDNEEATAANFEDGWFRPGDYGRLSADGVLFIDGRMDDIANIGGRKVPATLIEHAVLDCPGVSDAGVAAFPMLSGRSLLHCAIVNSGGADPAQITAHLLKLHEVTVRVVELPQIPRNEMGKIQRDRLRTEIAAVVPR